MVEYTKHNESCYIRRIQMIKNLLRIIRWPNLLMIAGIQLLIYLTLADRSHSVLDWSSFIMLSLITVITGAAGYVINDYYDVEIDRQNKPLKQVAGKAWSLVRVKYFYLSLLIVGFILSLILAWSLGLVIYIFIYPLAAFGLWLYSYSLKCRPVIGNLWVSLFCAGVIGIVILPDILLKPDVFISGTLWFYTGFAFLTTWYREVIKDMEDRDGDMEAQCKTAVVKYGLKVSKIMALLLSLFLVSLLLIWDSQQTDPAIKLGLNILEGFTVASMAFIWWAKNSTYFHYASGLVKLIMLGGTFLLLFL
jgi:4-hydroxybenzoate polyprenyltransferase